MSEGALIGGLCGGLGAALLGVGIGICIVCYAKHKAHQRGNWRGTDRFYGIDGAQVERVTEQYYSSRNTQPAPYVPRQAIHVSNPARYPGTTAPIQTQSNPSQSLGPDTRTREPESSQNNEPPSYNSVWEANDRTDESYFPARESQSSAITGTDVQQVHVNSSRFPDANTEYQPPPPEYEMAVEYPDLYKVTDREPKFV